VTPAPSRSAARGELARLPRIRGVQLPPVAWTVLAFIVATGLLTVWTARKGRSRHS